MLSLEKLHCRSRQAANRVLDEEHRHDEHERRADQEDVEGLRQSHGLPPQLTVKA
jgi:hypothetical protein